MEPGSAAGLALGVASLAIQVFDGATKGFEIFENAAHADQEAQAFKLRLRFEYDRLSKWGEITGLRRLQKLGIDEQTANEEEKWTKEAQKIAKEYDSQMRNKGPLVMATLSELHLILKQLRKSELEYDSIAEPETAGQDGALRLRASDISEPASTGEATANGDSYPNAEEREAFVNILSIEGGPKEARKRRKGLNHIMTGLSGAVKVTKQPKRLKWAVRGSKKVQEKLVRVKQLVDYLQDSLRSDQMEILLESMRTFKLMQLQLAASVGDLRALLVAERTTLLPSSASVSASALDGATLVDSAANVEVEDPEARFTAFYTAATQFSIDMSVPGIRSGESSKLAEQDIPSLPSPNVRDDGGRTFAVVKNGSQMWIEWKPYTMTGGGREVPKDTIERVERLVALLRSPGRPREFCVPTCRGYFQHGAHREFGLVFESPVKAANPWPPRSLLSCYGTRGVPLSTRIAVAQQLSQWLLYLHAVNWLHKALRSASILFFAGDGTRELGQPYVSGFEYSRIARGGMTTAGPPESGDRILYIHPDYLGNKHQFGFHKTYDMYSLGIILVEIAYWQPISEILGLSKRRLSTSGNLTAPSADSHTVAGAEQSEITAAKATPTPAGPPVSQVEKVRGRILNGEVDVLSHIHETMGGRYLKATKACLEGMPAFGLSEEQDQSNPSIGAMLQQAFIEVVVDSLKGINV